MLFVMNKAKYDSLPDDLKKIIDANSGAALAADLGRKWDEWDQIGRAAIVKRGTPIHVIDGPDLAAWKKAVEPLYASWTAERDKAGDNGAELFNAARELIAKHSQ
jgi:TRAP-type transport system periplasmic protein